MNQILSEELEKIFQKSPVKPTAENHVFICSTYWLKEGLRTFRGIEVVTSNILNDRWIVLMKRDELAHFPNK